MASTSTDADTLDRPSQGAQTVMSTPSPISSQNMSAKIMSPTSPRPCALLDLPSEVCSLIYEEVFTWLRISVKVTPHGSITRVQRILRHPTTGVSLLRCCRQINEEAFPSLVKMCTLALNISLLDYKQGYELRELFENSAIPVFLRRALPFIRKIILTPYSGASWDVTGFANFSNLQEVCLTRPAPGDMLWGTESLASLHSTDWEANVLLQFRTFIECGGLAMGRIVPQAIGKFKVYERIRIDVWRYCDEIEDEDEENDDEENENENEENEDKEDEGEEQGHDEDALVIGAVEDTLREGLVADQEENVLVARIIIDVELCSLSITARAMKRLIHDGKPIVEGHDELAVHGELWTTYYDAETMVKGIQAL